MARKICSTPGCPRICDSGRCPSCTTQAERDRGSAYQRGYGAKWQWARTQHLFEHPFCSVPGCTTPATDVDHRDNLGPLGPRGYDQDNLQGLCHSHHSKKTARETPGGFGQ